MRRWSLSVVEGEEVGFEKGYGEEVGFECG